MNLLLIELQFATILSPQLTFQLFQPSAEVESLSVLPWQRSIRRQRVDHEAGPAPGQSDADQRTSKLISFNRIKSMTNWVEFLRYSDRKTEAGERATPSWRKIF